MLNPQNSIHNVTVKRLEPTSRNPVRQLTHTTKYRSPSLMGRAVRVLKGKRC